MTLNIIQTITNVLDENREVLRTMTSEAFMLTPAAGKAIKNIKDGNSYTHPINIGSKGKLKDYIEIDINE